MEGEDNREKGRQSIPSLAHALEEARVRAKSQIRTDRAYGPELEFEERDHSRQEAAIQRSEDVAERQPKIGAKPRYRSLLDFAASSKTVSGNKIETARLAVEADAARRALSGRDVKVTTDMQADMQESMEAIRLMLDECLMAVRECREMVRTLAARRDRNYF